jgi:hypothetical protein
MRSLLVMGIPYQHAPEVSIVRTDTCLVRCPIGDRRFSPRNPAALHIEYSDGIIVSRCPTCLASR